MLPGYKQKNLNSQAFKSVDRGVDIPDLKLAIGFAEALDPVHIQLYPGVQRKAISPPPRSIDDVAVDGQGNPVKMSEFPRTFYMGEALGEV